MTVTDSKYVRLTTYTRSGEAKTTAVWIAPLGDGRAGFTTGAETWKLKRIRNTPAVRLQPSDARGNPTADSIEVLATAHEATSAEAAEVTKAIRAKYGWQVPAMHLVQRLGKLIGKGGLADTAVVVTLDQP